MNEIKRELRRALLAMCLMSLCCVPARAAEVRGDVNGDGSVNIADVTALIDILLTGSAGNNPEADCNQDGTVNIADVTSLIDRLLSGSWPMAAHEWVDLGLPSGTLWATCNVGADSPEEYGDYFAWGETEPKDVYDFSTYKWCNGEYGTLTKYLDRYAELEPEDDAATVNWGNEWCMPTDEQLIELGEQCNFEYVTRNGINGYLATGLNGNKLFFPVAGCNSEGPMNVGSVCYYWSRTLFSPGLYFDPNAAFCMMIDEWGVGYENFLSYRDAGRSVRAVRVLQN